MCAAEDVHLPETFLVITSHAANRLDAESALAAAYRSHVYLCGESGLMTPKPEGGFR